MKLIRYGRLIAGLFIAAMFCAALLFAGCAHNSAERDFAAVSAHLERGGTVYGVITRDAAFADGVKRCFARLEQFIGTSKYSESEKNAALQRIANVQAVWHFAGLHQLEGIGISSVPKTDGIFSNRIFLAVNPQFDCLINRVLRRKDGDVSAIIENLPQETFSAAGVDISGENILKFLSSSGNVGEKILQILPPGFPLEVLSSVEGWLILAIARNSVLPPEDNSIMLQIPDPEGKLFALLSMMIRRGKAAPMETRFVLPLVDNSICLNDPVVKKSGGKLVIYSSAAAEELFEKCPNGNLKKQPDFVRYSKNVSLSGSAFAYNRKLAAPGRAFVREIPLAGAVFQVEECNCFGVLSCRKNGWLWQEKSDNDLSGVIGEAGIYRQISKMVLPRSEKTVPQKSSAENKVKKNSRLNNDHCPAALKKLYADLIKYAGENQNKFPEFSGIKTLKKVFPKFRNPAGSRIFYFGSAARSKNHPLAISCHRNLTDSFCVLYADGKVQSYKLERAGSCRRIISFLYTVHRWDAKLFQHLIKQAQQLDDESAKKE